MIRSSRLTGFRNLDIDARYELLAQTTALDSTALSVLRPEQGLTLEQAAHMIENAVGVLVIPLGIALNFTINERDFLVPNGHRGTLRHCGGEQCSPHCPGTRRVLHLEY